MRKQLNKIFIFFLIILIIILTGCSKTSSVVESISSQSVIEESTLTPEVVISSPEPEPSPIIESIIETQPQTQEIEEGNSCYFLSIHSHNLKGTWFFISPDNEIICNIETIKEYAPNLNLSCDKYGGLFLANVDRRLNGWKVYCSYPDGLISNQANIIISRFIDENDIYR